MEMIARFKPGENVPGFATAQVNAGRFVKISAAKTAQGDYSVAHCAAGDKAFGVAERTSAAPSEPASSVERRINIVRRGAIVRVTAGGAITAGQEVQSDATGQAIVLGAGAAVGRACSSAASGAVVEVDLY